MAYPDIIRKITKVNFTDKNDTGRIEYIVVHYFGGLATVENLAKYWQNTYAGASAHYGVGHDGTIIQMVEDADIAWHCGASSYKHPKCRNSNSIGIEMAVYKTNKNHLYASDTDWYYTLETVVNTVKLVQYLMKKYNVPADRVIRHYDVTGKICPAPYVHNNQKYNYADFRNRLGITDNSASTTTDKLYRVRYQWTGIANLKADGQLGAYSSLDNAKASCPQGYNVYDWNGKLVYSNPKTAVGLSAKSLLNLSEAEVIEKVGPLYTADQRKTGILASVSMAQFILESGYGKSELAQNANNCHGMKCTLSGNDWSGSTWDGTSKYSKSSPEQDKDGNTSYHVSDFRKYDCVEDSIADHSAYLLGAKNGSAKRYAGINTETNYKKACQIIKDGGYATDVKYVEKLCEIIERWNLTKFDVETKPTTTPTAPATKPATTPIVKSEVKVDGTLDIVYTGSDGIVVHNTPDFNSSSANNKYGPVGPKTNKGSRFTVVAEITLSDGSKMYKLKSGLYITASTKYVKFTKTKQTLKYGTGNYVTNDVMNIRSGPGTEYPIKKWNEMSAGSKKTNPKTATNRAYYKKGCVFTALEVRNFENEAWARNPSGWVCLEQDGEKFCTKK